MITLSLVDADVRPPKVRNLRAKVLAVSTRVDPAVRTNPLVMERISAVSPNGRWAALRYSGPMNDRAVFSIIDLEHPGEETFVPQDICWSWPRAIGLYDNGTFVGRAELDSSDFEGSRRPFVFRPGDDAPVVLPPEYQRDFGHRENWPHNHTPMAICPDGRIFGWAFRPVIMPRLVLPCLECPLSGNEPPATEQKRRGILAMLRRMFRGRRRKQEKVSAGTAEEEPLEMEVPEDEAAAVVQTTTDAAKETPEDLHQAALPQESEDPFDADEPLLSDILPEKYMEERDEENTCWCVWEQAADGSWRVRYLPPHMSTLWLWPYGTREFIFATRHEPPEPGLIRFGVFDGRSSCILPMSIFGASPQIVGTAKDGSFWGRCSIHQEQGSASGDEAARSTKASSQTICFIGRPARAKELLLLDAPDMSLWIEAMSPSGRCVSGSYARHEPGNRKVVEHGVFLLEECREGYSFSIVEAPGWRLEEVEAVADNGDIFCAGVCTEPAEHCYRLKLPLRVMA